MCPYFDKFDKCMCMLYNGDTRRWQRWLDNVESDHVVRYCLHVDNWKTGCALVDRIEKKGIYSSNSSSGWCYVATCVYGSYDCPEVWTLRRFRDDVMKKSIFGKMFIRIYYSTSPILVAWFGRTKWFNKFFKFILDPFVRVLQNNGIARTPYDDK